MIDTNKIFTDKEGREVIIKMGIDNRNWGPFRQKPNGSFQKVKSPSLPMRHSKEMAFLDLEKYAILKKWKVIQN